MAQQLKHLARCCTFAAALALAGVAQAEDATGYDSPTAPQARAAREDIQPVLRQGHTDLLGTIRQRGTLRVGVVPVEPMVMRNAKGEWAGFSVELAQKLSDDMGVSLEIVPTSWVDVMPDLLSRQYDVIITGLWRSTQRALVVNFTQPTATEGVYLLAHQRAGQTRPYPEGYNRAGVRLGVLDDPLHLQIAKEAFPLATVVRVDEASRLSTLSAGQLDAALFTTLSPEALKRQAKGRVALASAEPLAHTSAAMAIRKGDADFLNFLDTWLAIQKETGWLDRQASRWSQTR